jgi:hypothetical protein
MFKTIRWATDGSETADRAPAVRNGARRKRARRARRRAQQRGLHGRAAGFPILADEEDLEKKIHRQVDGLPEEGFDVTFKLVSGPHVEAAHAIADVAREVEADAIVVGAYSSSRTTTASTSLSRRSVCRRPSSSAPRSSRPTVALRTWESMDIRRRSISRSCGFAT